MKCCATIRAAQVMLLVAGALLPGSSFAKARIWDIPIDPARCLGDRIGGSACDEVRVKFRNDGCIDDAELTYARRPDKNIFPLCINLGGEWLITNVCTCGCFEKNTRVGMFGSDGQMQWRAISQAKGSDVPMIMSADAGLKKVAWSAAKMGRMTHGPETDDLFVFGLLAGGDLAVTAQHALMLADGRMVAAKDVTIDDALMGIGGQPMVLASLTRRSTRDDVFNLLIDSPEAADHLIGAEGVVVGDVAWQDALQADLDSVQVRQ